MMLTSDISIGEAGVYALLGYAVVFFGLILLMCVVTAIGKYFSAKDSRMKAAASAAAKATAPAAPAAAAAPVSVAAGEPVKSPMPGNILRIEVSQGQQVKEGDVLMVLEAMKMENEIVATKSGTIAQIAVSKGAVVETGAVLAVIA